MRYLSLFVPSRCLDDNYPDLAVSVKGDFRCNFLAVYLSTCYYLLS